MTLTLKQANAIAEAALAQGVALKTAPLCVAVVDAGGHLIALQRQDGASNLRPQIATTKATGALALGLSSRKIAAIATDRPAIIASLAAMPGGSVVPTPGGVIIIDERGIALGAVGVTGDTGDNDEHCAIAGAKAAGFAVRE